MWKLIDLVSNTLCRWGFHDWQEWRANTYSGRVLMDWSRDCERCGKLEWASGKTSPNGQPHPEPTSCF